MSLAFQCHCNTVQGELLRPDKSLRAVCYCQDCQTYVHALGGPARVLDEHGGTEVVATQARYIRFTAGTGALACLSLTDRGLLRWYASCCRTPLANTPRDMRFPYASVLTTCLVSGGAHAEALLGPVRMWVNTRHAKGTVPKPGIGQWLALLRIAPGLLWARLCGSWRSTPFFDVGCSRPVIEPYVLTDAERRQARSMV
ncbi:MAG TPA: DUF6151 family protein [Burkholderiaceae bacterium]|nr:DUF6151 family protein [Burkholderiaceae bacterium]